MTPRRKKDPTPCSTPGCWQDEVCCGFCAACYSGWRRITTLTVPEIGVYVRRLKRLENRVGLAQRRGALIKGARIGLLLAGMRRQRRGAA